MFANAGIKGRGALGAAIKRDFEKWAPDSQDLPVRSAAVIAFTTMPRSPAMRPMVSVRSMQKGLSERRRPIPKSGQQQAFDPTSRICNSGRISWKKTSEHSKLQLEHASVRKRT
jgi:hypothetical protein